MDRRQALKCAIGAAAGVVLGGLPAAESTGGGIAGSSVLVDAELLSLPMMRRVPVSMYDVWLTPDGHICHSWKFIAATLENDSGDVATIKPYRDGALNPSAPGLKQYSRAIVDNDGTTGRVVIVNVPDSFVAVIDERGQATIVRADGSEIFKMDKPIATAIINPVCGNSSNSCLSCQREGIVI